MTFSFVQAFDHNRHNFFGMEPKKESTQNKVFLSMCEF